MKNIILLITDTYRYDNLAGEGGGLVRTPYLDRFMHERGLSLSRYYTGSFPTIPHRTDLATGRLGWPHYGWQGIDQSSPNHIATMLSAKGYATQLICDCPHLFNSGFNAKFDAAVQNRGQEGDRPLLHLNDPIRQILPDEKTRQVPRFAGANLADSHRWINRYMQFEADAFSSRTASTTVRWLEENYLADPFFLWVDFFDPHEPWDPPEYMVRRYDPDYTGVPMLHPNYGRSDAYTEEELQNLRAHYRAEAELVDRQLGRVIEKIDDLDLWDDSIVIVTTDHGMSIGEHGRTGKSNLHESDDRYWPIYPEVSHIPFLVAAPGVQGGQVMDFFFQPMDILPTVGDLAGVSLDPPEPIQGFSAASLLTAGGGQSKRSFAVSGCNISTGDEQGGVPGSATVPFLTTEKWGYAPVGAEGAPELYDLSNDPYARENVAKGNHVVLKELNEIFLTHLREYGAPDKFLSMWEKLRQGTGAWAIDYE